MLLYVPCESSFISTLSERLRFFFLKMRQNYNTHTNIDKIIKMKMIAILDSKNCYQLLHIQVIIKYQKNMKNIVELAVNIEKNNWKRLHSRCKLRY